MFFYLSCDMISIYYFDTFIFDLNQYLKYKFMVETKLMAGTSANWLRDSSTNVAAVRLDYAKIAARKLRRRIKFRMVVKRVIGETPAATSSFAAPSFSPSRQHVSLQRSPPAVIMNSSARILSRLI
ncbi:hypothetical protein CR155_12460 [Pollutimonas nitritireducens]|uniref:Uncharacterized protein n=1 Tax=Pollutimonas nitritireducens TaxID=2045209 RepID=A0A2N4UF28_9BURK|nr:hypothetical protein CR155_12460 [Pollutimonas nitritireducens]